MTKKSKPATGVATLPSLSVESTTLSVGGRPTKYREDYNKVAYKLCLLGSTDKQLADFFDVTEQTINNWKNDYPSFFESIKAGKEQADAQVAQALFHRALGYEAKEEHIHFSQGEAVVTPITKQYPPDATSAIFWLKNRQPKNWRDKQVVDHTGQVGLKALLDDIDGTQPKLPTPDE